MGLGVGFFGGLVLGVLYGYFAFGEMMSLTWWLSIYFIISIIVICVLLLMGGSLNKINIKKDKDKNNCNDTFWVPLLGFLFGGMICAPLSVVFFYKCLPSMEPTSTGSE